MSVGDDPADGPRERSRIPEARENAILAWARAIGLGIRDTASDVLEEGRAGARAKRAQMWERFDGKTRNRRIRK